MGKYGRARQRKDFKWTSGGLVTLPADNHIELLSKGRLYAVRSENVEYVKRGSASKSRGWSKMGGYIDGGSGYVNLLSTISSASVAGGATSFDARSFATYVTTPAGSGASIASCRMRLSLTGATGNLYCSIRTIDGFGLPSTVVTNGRSRAYVISGDISSDNDILFEFETPPALSASTSYFVCIDLVPLASQSETISMSVVGNAFYGFNGVKTTATYPNYPDYTGTNVLVTNFCAYLKLQATTPVVTGLWDLRFENTGNIFQFYGAACGGSLYAGNPTTVDGGGSWGTPICSGLANSASLLYDKKVFKNLAFFTDYATNGNRAWDGVDGSLRSPAADYGSPTRAQSTMAHGYRPSIVLAATSRSGRAAVWSSVGKVKILLATQLTSGGYRCAEFEQTLSFTDDQINITSSAFDKLKTEMYFDIGDNATTIFITKPGGSTYYLCPVDAALAGGLSTANPTPNATSARTIYPCPDALLEASGDIERWGGNPQGYYTLQVDTPKFKGLEVFFNMLCGWGDPNNPSRVWVSEQGAPQVWGTYGSTLGNYIDVAPEDGEIVTGIRANGEALFVAKQHSLYRVDFTGDFNDPFRVDKVKGFVGCLSHWSMETIPEGLFFLSELGPAVCYGTFSKILPATSNIANLFDKGHEGRFDQSGLSLAVSCNDATRGLLYMTVSRQGSTIRDQVLVYDYEGQQFSLMKDFNACFIANIADSNAFPSPWYSNYQAEAFKQGGELVATSNAGAHMEMVLETPFLELGTSFEKKSSSFLWIAADVTLVSGQPTTDGVYVDVMTDGDETVKQTLYFSVYQDYERNLLALGASEAIGPMYKTIKLRVRTRMSNHLNISSLALDFTVEGQDK